MDPTDTTLDFFEVSALGEFIGFNVTHDPVNEIVGKVELIMNRCPYTPEKIYREDNNRCFT